MIKSVPSIIGRFTLRFIKVNRQRFLLSRPKIVLNFVFARNRVRPRRRVSRRKVDRDGVPQTFLMVPVKSVCGRASRLKILGLKLKRPRKNLKYHRT